MITAAEWMAKDFASRWSKPAPDTCAQDALAHAYLTGFNKAKLMAAELVNDLKNKNGMATLILAIAKAEVDPETGERVEYD